MAIINISDVTEETLVGTGTFDALMRAVTAHLDAQYAANRIRGQEYATVYLGALQAVLGQAIQFELGKQQADKQAELLVAQTELTNIQKDLELAKVADQLYVTANIRPLEVEQLTEQVDLLQNQDAEVIASTIRQDNQSVAQIDSINIESSIKQLQSSKDALIKDGQVIKLQEEVDLLQSQDKQVLSQISQTSFKNQADLVTQYGYESCSTDANGIHTLNLRSNAGLVYEQTQKVIAEQELLGQKKTTEQGQLVTQGKQQGLYQAQTDGFIRDAEQKAAKIIADVWNVAATSGAYSTTTVAAMPDISAGANLETLLHSLADNAGLNYTIT